MSEEYYEAPRDVIEIEDVINQVKIRKRSKRKSLYPTRKDLAEAVKASTTSFTGNPDEFPEKVLDMLSREGFDTSYVTVKRIWKTYEDLVRRKIIRDFLGVVGGSR